MVELVQANLLTPMVLASVPGAVATSVIRGDESV